MQVKCVMVGDEAVGKTCLVVSHANGKFPSDCVPSEWHNGYAFPSTIDGKQCTLGVFEVPGRKYHETTKGVTYPQTEWVPEITHYCPKKPFILVGTQVDLRDDAAVIEKLAETKQKPISLEQGNELAQELKAVKFVECSALTLNVPP